MSGSKGVLTDIYFEILRRNNITHNEMARRLNVTPSYLTKLVHAPNLDERPSGRLIGTLESISIVFPEYSFDYVLKCAFPQIRIIEAHDGKGMDAINEALYEAGFDTLGSKTKD